MSLPSQEAGILAKTRREKPGANPGDTAFLPPEKPDRRHSEASHVVAERYMADEERGHSTFPGRKSSRHNELRRVADGPLGEHAVDAETAEGNTPRCAIGERSNATVPRARVGSQPDGRTQRRPRSIRPPAHQLQEKCSAAPFCARFWATPSAKVTSVQKGDKR